MFSTLPDSVPLVDISSSKVTEIYGSGSGSRAAAGGLVASTAGAKAGLIWSTSVVWLSSTRPSAVVINTPPRLPPVASVTCCKVATSTMVSTLSGETTPVESTGPELCEMNSSPASTVPASPKARLSMALLKVSMVTARWRLLNSTTWLRSGSVTAQTLPSLSMAIELTCRFWSRLHWVKTWLTGSKVEMPFSVLT